MNFKQVLAQLDARTNYEASGRLVAPTLERITALLEMLGDPQGGIPAIHITGTNGKTTTARAATEVLRASDLSVATFTSPHVESITERIQADATPISENEFIDAWRELVPFMEHIDETVGKVTWFEAITALAFIWFADKGVDVAVIEVGMGGTWDATSVVETAVAAITRIDVDHAHVLGDTPAKIAVEKAGIIKPDSVLVTVEQTQEVFDVLRARCEEVGAEIRSEPMSFELEKSVVAVGGQSVDLRLGREYHRGLFLPMFGEQFAHNAALGAAAVHAFMGDRPQETAILEEAFAKIKVPGRLEVIQRNPLVILDGAHNPAAAAALASALPHAFDYENVILVIGAMTDKDVPGMLAPLVKLSSGVVATQANWPRAMTAPDVAAAAATAGAKVIAVEQNVPDAIKAAIAAAGDRDCVLVTGSLYTVGEARTALAAR